MEVEQHRVEEVSLAHLLRMLARRGRIIMASGALSLLLAATYLILANPVYQSRAVLQVGQVGKDGLVEDPTLLVRRLRERYRVGEKGSLIYPSVVDVLMEKGGPPTVITIISRGYSAEDARRSLSAAIEPVIAEHDAIYRELMVVYVKRRQAMQRDVDVIDKQIQGFRRIRVENRQENQLTSIIALSITAAPLMAAKLKIDADVADSEIALHLPSSRPTRLLLEPTTNEAPIEPKYGLIGVLGTMFGLILSVMGVLFFDLFLRKPESPHGGSGTSVRASKT